MEPFSYTCPFCSRIATITEKNHASGLQTFDIGNAAGQQYLKWDATSCPNPECRRYRLRLALHDARFVTGVGNTPAATAKQVWQLVPNGASKLFPEYIPDALRRDYAEACLIRDLSPKASATLSRRCLQGMLRDFWGATGRTLYDEIESVKDKLDATAWEAIHAVRELGNIGAHMKANVNEIIDVDPGEAEALTDLIEILFADWYVAKQERADRMAKVKAIAESKRTRSPAEES